VLIETEERTKLTVLTASISAWVWHVVAGTAACSPSQPPAGRGASFISSFQLSTERQSAHVSRVLEPARTQAAADHRLGARTAARRAESMGLGVKRLPRVSDKRSSGVAKGDR
jgi:hypothetical protein